MKDLVMQDEWAMTAGVVESPFALMKQNKTNDIYFLGDNNFICDYLLKAFNTLNSALHKYRSVAYLSYNNETDYRKTTLEQVKQVTLLNSLGSLEEKSVVFFFVDCVGGLKEKEATLAALKRITDLLKQNKHSKCVVSVLLPAIPAFSSKIETLSEREYNFYIEKQCDITPEIAYYIEVEKMCRTAVSVDALDITMARFDNVFAPDVAHTPIFNLIDTVCECHKQKAITITDEDKQKHFTITYIRSACHAVAMLALKARQGHIYNVTGENVSIETIKQNIYNANPQVYSLNVQLSANLTPIYAGLNSLKYKKLGTHPREYIEIGIKHLVAYYTGEEYDTSSNVAFYSGKIERIQSLELKVLKEIDAICRRNNIKYFLAGGTLLGAVRSGKSIPWDDDLDIGMLREDFEKFRKVCPKELGPEFNYSSTFNDSGSHYTTDKVRLNDTYFSTNYSNKNQFNDGIFLDILVYDKTSNSKLFQKLHAFVLTALTVLYEIKWFDKPRKKVHYIFTKIFLPLLRIIPWGLFNALFDFFAKIYRNKKNAKWLIDSVGKKVNGGPLPNKGLDEVVYVDFEGISAPIPVDPKPYLIYAYGESYMQQPILSKRRCPHNFARIDLGKYLFSNEEDASFQSVNIKGELYECEEV